MDAVKDAEFELTEKLGRSMLASRLIARHAERLGYPGQANWASSALFSRWLELPAPRGDFHTWVINELQGEVA